MLLPDAKGVGGDGFMRRRSMVFVVVRVLLLRSIERPLWRTEKRLVFNYFSEHRTVTTGKSAAAPGSVLHV